MHLYSVLQKKQLVKNALLLKKIILLYNNFLMMKKIIWYVIK